MYAKGYKLCKIFAYTESLLAQYQTGPGDDELERGFHKRIGITASKEEVALSKLDMLKDELKDIEGQMNSHSQKKVWLRFLSAAKGDREKAMKAVLDNDFACRQFLGALPPPKAKVGGRARKFRIRFHNGIAVADDFVWQDD